jgi:hypothetical protein
LFAQSPSRTNKSLGKGGGTWQQRKYGASTDSVGRTATCWMTGLPLRQNRSPRLRISSGDFCFIDGVTALNSVRFGCWNRHYHQQYARFSCRCWYHRQRRPSGYPTHHLRRHLQLRQPARLRNPRRHPQLHRQRFLQLPQCCCQHYWSYRDQRRSDCDRCFEPSHSTPLFSVGKHCFARTVPELFCPARFKGF